MALPETRTYTVDDFEGFLTQTANPDRLYELTDGNIVEKHFYTEVCSITAAMLLYALTEWAMAGQWGLPAPSRSFSVLGDEHNVRTPNISLIVDDNRPVSTERVMAYVPESIAEIKTPDDSIDDMREKAGFYIRSGARLVWLVYPRQRIVEVYRPDTPTEMLTAADTLHGYDVLPDFTLPIVKLFPEKRSG